MSKSTRPTRALGNSAIRLNLWESHPVGFLVHADGRETEVGMGGETWRHLVENFFVNKEEFRALATRFDKTASSQAANWRFTATVIASR